MNDQSTPSPVTETAEDFNMSAEPVKFGPFTITLPPQKGGPRQFVLTEASEKAHNAYKAITTRALRMSLNEKTEEQRATIDGGQEADAVLVANCLTEIVEVGPIDPSQPLNAQTERPVTVDFVLSLPRRITSRLYNKVRQMSGMDEDQETVLFLERRIKSDTAKLARLKTGNGEPGKGEPSSTLHTSS